MTSTYLTEQEKEEITRENIDFAYYMAYKFLTDNRDKDEIISASMLGFTRALNTYKKDSNTKFVTYAGLVIQNEIFQYFRKKRTRAKEKSLTFQFKTSEEEGDMLERIPAPEKAIDTETMDVINRVTCKLNERRKKIFDMYTNGFKDAEIAEVIGRSRTMVNRDKQAILREIKKELEKC